MDIIKEIKIEQELHLGEEALKKLVAKLKPFFLKEEKKEKKKSKK